MNAFLQASPSPKLRALGGLAFLAVAVLLVGVPAAKVEANSWDCNIDPNPTYCSGDCIGNCHSLFFACDAGCHGPDPVANAQCESRCENRFVRCLQRCPI